MTITRRHFIQGAAAAALLSTTGTALAADTIKMVMCHHKRVR